MSCRYSMVPQLVPKLIIESGGFRKKIGFYVTPLGLKSIIKSGGFRKIGGLGVP